MNPAPHMMPYMSKMVIDLDTLEESKLFADRTVASNSVMVSLLIEYN
jgi:hypothetical protein